MTAEQTTKPCLDINDLDILADVVTDAEVSTREDARAQRLGVNRTALIDTANMLQELRDRIYATKEKMEEELHGKH